MAWKSVCGLNGSKALLRIVGDLDALKEFVLHDPEKVEDEDTGTTVRVSNAREGMRDLRGDAARNQLIQLLAPYLASYPSVKVVYDGSALDLAAVSDGDPEDLPLDPIPLEDGRTVEASLTVRSWTFPNERRIALCDAHGFTLAEVPAGRSVRAPGFNFTAYLKTDYFKSHHDAGTLEISEMFAEDEGISKLLSAARKSLATYFKERMEDRAAALLEEWRRENIYPFKDEPVTVVEKAERQVFDIVALNVDRYLPGFPEMETEAKQLIFECLRVAIDSGEDAARRLVGSLTKIPKNKQKDLLDLIEKTSWVALIEASRSVTDRLEFLAGLRGLLFRPDFRKVTRERSQLHRLLAKNIWVFGEHFNLTVDDQSLREVLKRHEELLGRGPSGKDVIRDGGKKGIVDLMLSGLVSPSDPRRREHLVVELKAPKITLGKKELDQVESYARAVVRDPQFAGYETEWHFWVICDEVDEVVEDKRTIAGLPKGVTYRKDNPKVTVWAKQWGEIINECEARLRFFQEKLKYAPTEEDGAVHLATEYAKHVPSAVHRAAAEAAAKQGKVDQGHSLAAEEQNIVNGILPAAKDDCGGDEEEKG